jgi:hypothetical protein
MRRDFFYRINFEMKTAILFHKNALHRFYKLVVEKNWRISSMAVTLYS